MFAFHDDGRDDETLSESEMRRQCGRAEGRSKMALKIAHGVRRATSNKRGGQCNLSRCPPANSGVEMREFVHVEKILAL